MNSRLHSCSYWILTALPLCLFLAGAGCQAEGPLPVVRPEKKAEESSKKPDEKFPTVTVGNMQDLRSRLGQKLTVTGDVSRIGTSGSGHRFINFTGNPELSIFIASSDVAKFRPDPPEKAFESKTIAVTGQLERFNGKLQIQVRSPEAIQVIVKPRGPPEKTEHAGPAAVELKSLGRDQWISPAGLKYVGRDPEGRTRKEHVLRHARDIPDRDGPHGVFDGGEEVAFAWIDAAWEKIQKQKIRPQPEEGRDVYTVNMGQRVGYLGGQSGARSSHPPLSKIFLVLRKGTTEVVTAFPK